MNDGLTLPLAILTTSGKLLGALLMNKKAYQKSLEQRELWVVHPATERVLPMEGIRFTLLLEKEGSWYQALLAPDKEEAFLKAKEILGAEVPTSASRSDDSGPGTPSGTTIIERLAATIKTRRKEMPVGSYTTHLFEKGEEKIRKKTGEEAIELLLAKDSGEIVYEAADLIYHMMVLLEVKDISITEVLSELEKRMK